MKAHLPLLLAASVVLTCASSQAESEKEAWEKVQDEAARVTEGLPEDTEEGKKTLADRLREQRAGLASFLADFPQSGKRWEARMAVMQISNSLDMLEEREPDFSAQEKELRSIAQDANAPENIRADAGLVLLQIATAAFDAERNETSARELSAAIAGFLELHPDDARAPVLRLTEAQALENFDPDRARALYAEAAEHEDGQIAQAGKDGIAMMDMRSKPMELSFTAVDGREVDLADLRGKVVLVDFWATWCPPCVEEAPALAAVYEKHKAGGFEIIGISLDRDKKALQDFTAAHNMVWPQFFDGQGWDNELAKRFKIQSIPTMWLLDREGKLVDANPRSRLEQAVEAALARKP